MHWLDKSREKNSRLRHAGEASIFHNLRPAMPVPVTNDTND